jgi:hypothetical protein
MRELSTLKKQIAALQATASAERSSSPYGWLMYATDEEKRKEFINVLAGPDGIAARAFGAEDPRASRNHLSTLALSDLSKLFREGVYILAPREIDPEEKAWFRSLPYPERIRVLRSGNVSAHYPGRRRIQNEGKYSP